MDDMQMEWMRTKDTLSHNVVCAQGESVREKLSCEVYLSTHPVGYSGSLSTVNETNCNKKELWSIKKNYELTSNSLQTCPTTMCLKMNAIVFVDLDGDAFQLVLLIRGVDDFSSRRRLENQIEVS